MATSKTLTPTNVTIQIPDFTDRPDQRANSNCIDKEADAINALNSQITNLGSCTLLGSRNDAGSVTLSESMMNYWFIVIVVQKTDRYYEVPVIPTALISGMTYDTNQALLEYVISSGVISVCRYWYQTNTSIEVRDACKVYGLMHK